VSGWDQEASEMIDAMPLEGRLRFEAIAMKAAINNEDTPGSLHLGNWHDKPHRVLYDAIDLMEDAADRLESIVAEIKFLKGAAEAHERKCQCCDDSMADRADARIDLADELLDYIAGLDVPETRMLK
jgi:hypothetical protein